MGRRLRSYKFTYLDRDGQVIGTLDVECTNDDSAVARGLAARPRVASIVDVVCGRRLVAREKLSGA